MGIMGHNEKKKYSHYENSRWRRERERERDRNYIGSYNGGKLPKPGERNTCPDPRGSKDPKPCEPMQGHVRHMGSKLVKVKDKEINLKAARENRAKRRSKQQYSNCLTLMPYSQQWIYNPDRINQETVDFRINKETVDLNNTAAQLDLTDICDNSIHQQQNLHSS